ncbi:MAG: type II toxin-antitoxin system Phd/YefM family antitoxin [Spirochaetaceae bacterium]
MNRWALQDAKARFSELVNRSLEEGPQEVTRHGKTAVVVVAAEEYRRLSAPSGDLGDFLLSAPRVELDVRRSLEAGREVEL